MSSGKKTLGRQKLAMEKISKESNLHVTFSKRRNGLFKKASELFTLCGAYVALFVFSPSGRAFSFGHPDVHTVIDRFLSWVQPQIFIEATRNANVRELNAELTLINDALDFEKKRGDDLSHLCKMTEDLSWWACPIDRMTQPQLELLKIALEDLKKHVGQQDVRLVILDAPAQIEQAQMLPTQFFQNPMLQSHLLGFNNMEGGEYGPEDLLGFGNMGGGQYGPSGSF